MEGPKSENEAAILKIEAEIRKELEEMVESMRVVSIESEVEAQLNSDPSVDLLIKTKLHSESEIEAVMQEKLLELPDDEKLLIQLAREEGETMTINNARCIDFYRDKVRQLTEEKKLYDTLVQKATVVNDKLDKLLSEHDREDKLETLSRRYETTGILFKSLRSELQLVINDLYPEQGDFLSMEDLLEKLITKMLNDAQDPYITTGDEIQDSHLAFLLRANLIVRHPTDALKIKFVDPRF